MTEEELLKVPFRWSGRVSMAHEHTTTYINTDYGFIMVVRVSVLKNGRFGRERREFQYNGMWYKKFDKFLEAIKEVELKLIEK